MNKSTRKVKNILAKITLGVFVSICLATLSGCFTKGSKKKPTVETIESVELDTTDLKLNLSKVYTHEFRVYINHNPASNDDVTWSVDDSNILSISNGLLTAKAVGESDISCVAKKDTTKSARCHVTVINTPPVVTGVEINETELDLNVYGADTFQFEAVVLGENEPSQNVMWDSNIPTVVSIDNDGLATAKSPGNAVISCISSANPSFSATCNVTVIDTTPVVTSFSLAYNEIVLRKNEDIVLGHTIVGTHEPSDEVTYKLDDLSIASIDEDGLITAKKLGETKVTVTSVQDPSFSAECAIKVIDSNEYSSKELDYTIDDYMNNCYYDFSNFPSTGGKMLIIPIWFTNSSDYVDPTMKDVMREDIYTAFLGNEEETGWHSVKTYYEDESFNTMTITGEIAEWYECGYSISQLVNTDGVHGNIVNNAVNWYFSTSGQSRQDFDLDQDGYLDCVCYVYASPNGANLGSSSTYLWAFTTWTGNQPNKSNPQENVYFWSSYDFIYGEDNCMERTGSAYYYGDTSYCHLDAHCFIHEMGHVFGLNDYYDYSGTTNPAGGFSMQDMNVGSHDPYSIMSIGWADPIVPVESTNIHIEPFQESGDFIILSNHNETLNSPYDEYLLIELYSPTRRNAYDHEHSYRGRYPQGASNVGVRLWHVDARLFSFQRYEITSNPNDGYVWFGASNSHGGYASTVFGNEGANFNELQLLTKNKEASYLPDFWFNDDLLFYEGDSFNMVDQARQFYKKGRLNSGQNLGWSIAITSLDDQGANIMVSKN